MRYIYFYESGESGQSKRGKVNGPSESGRSRVKVDGLLTESGRSFDGKWTVLLQVYGPGVKWTVQRVKVDGPKDESGRSKG